MGEEYEMKMHRQGEDPQERAANQVPPVAAESEPGPVPAWEQIEPGRYMPRRIRGSFRGRVLG